MLVEEWKRCKSVEPDGPYGKNEKKVAEHCHASKPADYRLPEVVGYGRNCRSIYQGAYHARLVRHDH